MSWGNPWAWLGVVALAVPLLIHTLGRRQATTLPFPTLRFLGASRLQPVRRTRMQDLALLALRIAVLVVAVAALAQPRIGNRQDVLDATALARVVIVDTSASMRRPAVGAQAMPADAATAAEIAQRDARRIADEAPTSVIVETAEPAVELAGADAWLSARSGRGEVIILSDFQHGAIDTTALAAISTAFGIDLRRVAVEVATTPVETTSRTAELETVARAVPTTAGLDVAWTFRPGASTMDEGLSLLADESDARTARDAALAAWRALPDVRFDAARPVTIVYEEYVGRADLLRAARTPGAPWMAETIRLVRKDALWLAAARRAEPVAEPAVALAPDGPFVRIGDPTEGGTVAAGAIIDGREQLVFFTNASPASLMSTALIGAIGRALSDRPHAAEADPAVLSDSVLASWRRAPAARTTTMADEAGSDGRWFWLIVAALLAVEALYRRRTDALRRSATSGLETAA